MRIVCWQTILIKYHALFVIFKKAAKFEMSSAALIIGGALWDIDLHPCIPAAVGFFFIQVKKLDSCIKKDGRF